PVAVTAAPAAVAAVAARAPVTAVAAVAPGAAPAAVTAGASPAAVATPVTTRDFAAARQSGHQDHAIHVPVPPRDLPGKTPPVYRPMRPVSGTKVLRQ